MKKDGKSVDTRTHTYTRRLNALVILHRQRCGHLIVAHAAHELAARLPDVLLHRLDRPQRQANLQPVDCPLPLTTPLFRAGGVDVGSVTRITLLRIAILATRWSELVGISQPAWQTIQPTARQQANGEYLLKDLLGTHSTVTHVQLVKEAKERVCASRCKLTKA